MNKLNMVISISDGNGMQQETILKKLESKETNPNSSCRRGFCGDCAMDLVEGEITYISDPIGYCHENQILTCISKLKTDTITVK